MICQSFMHISSFRLIIFCLQAFLYMSESALPTVHSVCGTFESHLHTRLLRRSEVLHGKWVPKDHKCPLEFIKRTIYLGLYKKSWFTLFSHQIRPFLRFLTSREHYPMLYTKESSFGAAQWVNSRKFQTFPDKNPTLLMARKVDSKSFLLATESSFLVEINPLCIIVSNCWLTKGCSVTNVGTKKSWQRRNNVAYVRYYW